MFITDVNALGLNVAQGLNFTETFYWDMNDQTLAFTKRFSEKYSEEPADQLVQAGVYSVPDPLLQGTRSARRQSA